MLDAQISSLNHVMSKEFEDLQHARIDRWLAVLSEKLRDVLDLEHDGGVLVGCREPVLDRLEEVGQRTW